MEKLKDKKDAINKIKYYQRLIRDTRSYSPQNAFMIKDYNAAIEKIKKDFSISEKEVPPMSMGKPIQAEVMKIADRIDSGLLAEYTVKEIERNGILLVQLLVHNKVVAESEQSYEHLFNLTKRKIKEGL